MLPTAALNQPTSFCKEKGAQVLGEYALMSGFVAMTAGAIIPGVAIGINSIFETITSVMATGLHP